MYVVSLLATVHDKEGRVVKNLTPESFALKEDGKEQKIRYFSQESDLPLNVGILVDTSRSQTDVLSEEKQASDEFLNETLREGTDQAFITHFDTKVETLQGLTSSRVQLSSALNRLSVPGNYATLIFSAVKESSDEILRRQKGRKALILLTDGVAFKDPQTLDSAIEAAQRADVIIFSIRFSDRIAVIRPVRAGILAAASEKGKSGLKRMSAETGGVAYEVGKGHSLAEIFSEIEDVLRNQYSIGYTPPRSEPDDKYHKIRLTAKDHQFAVHTRDGYYATKSTKP